MTENPNVHLVIGPPRSGTTLLGNLLGGADGAMSLSEPCLAHAFMEDWRLQRFFRNLQRDMGLRRRTPPCDGDLDRFWRFLRWTALENGYANLIVKETFRVSETHPDWRSEATLSRLLQLENNVTGIIRHPYDVAASMIRLCASVTGWRRWIMWLLMPNIPRAKTTTDVVRQGAKNWAVFVEWAKRKDLRVARYEDLVRDPHDHLEEVCDWIDLPFDEQMLDNERPRKAFGGIGDPGLFQAPRAVDKTSIGKNEDLTDDQRRIVREICGDLADEFDYTM